MIPRDLINLILEFHRPMCTLDYTGRPEFTLYWVYDIEVLKNMLSVGAPMERVDSRLGVYFKRQRY